MEQVLMDLVDDSPVYLEIMQARFEFFYEMQRRTLEAAGGLVDFAHVGDDLGNQRGPMIGLPCSSGTSPPSMASTSTWSIPTAPGP